MYKTLFRDYIYPGVVFAGGMVGVGFLSLPYVAAQTNIWLVFFYFVLLTYLVLMINLMFAEISLKTPDRKRFPGFVGYHLGKWWESVAMVLTVLGAFGVLLACLLVGSNFLRDILSPILGGNLAYYAIAYVLCAGFFIFLGIKLIKRIELVILSLLLLVILWVFAEGFFHIQIGNIVSFKPLSVTGGLLPFGPILFALWGITMVPEVEEMLIGEKNKLKAILITSTIAVSCLYFLFILLVVGISGVNTTESAFIGLRKYLGNGAVPTSLFVGALATITGFITQGISLKNMFVYDVKVKPWQATVFACLTPLIFLLLGVNSPVYLISLVGALFLGGTGIMILFMYRKIGGKNFVFYPLFLIFLVGIVYQVILFIKK